MTYFKKLKHKTALALVVILIIASVLRLWQIGSVPISPDWDEAAYGFNAYSVIQTGKDEFGEFLPVVLRSFDDYKPALYLYLVIPFVSLMGITTEAVRLPSALAGITTVLLTFFLVRRLTKRTDLALLTSFLLAISPWHIQFSRIAFEANVGVLLNLSLIYFFLKGLKKPGYLILAVVFAALSLYAYQSEKVFTPLLTLLLIGVYFKDLRKISLTYLGATVIVGLVVAAPMLFYLTTNAQALTRARETSIFADKNNLMTTARRLDADTKSGDMLGLVFDNRRVFYAIKIAEGYLSHFSLNWLFITGDNNPRHHAPGMSLLYLFELPFLLLGIYFFLFSPFSKQTKWFVFLWFLLAPVPASITSGVPHAVRTINFLPLFQLFTAYGILTSFVWLKAMGSKRKHTQYLAWGGGIVLGTVMLLNVSYYLNQYFVQMNFVAAKDWQYGYEEAVPYIQGISDSYEKIVITNKEPLDQSYIFFLYYLTYDPALYQQEADKNSSGGFAETHAFGKYEFRPIDWNSDKNKKNTLFIGRPADFPDGTATVKEISYPNGEKAILMVSPK